MKQTVAERFWAKVDRRGPDECWEWTAGLDTSGYGRFKLAGQHGQRVAAHRFAWESVNGITPAGLVMMHLCDNKQCVNPRHLTPGTRSENGYDWVAKGCPPKTDKRHAKPRRPPPTTEERFWSRVDKSGDCHLWTGARTPAGYGMLSVAGVPTYAHRLAWTIKSCARIPAGLFVLHRCDHPPCVNPDHLWLGTNADNRADADSKGRAKNPPLQYGDEHWTRRRPELKPRGDEHWARRMPERLCRGERQWMNTHPEKRMRGTKNGMAKLTVDNVARIRRLRSDGWKLRVIAGAYGISIANVHDIVKRNTWAHVA